MRTAELIAADGEHAEAWQASTRHRFLDEVHSGALPAAALNTWLVQDYHFVERLLRFQALLLSAAPRRDQLVLAGGLLALAEELDWFQGIAGTRGLHLAAPLQTECRAYTDYLLGLGAACRAPGSPAAGDGAYTIAITALWAVERAYLDAWLGARPGAPAYAAFVEHWTVAGFRDYVDGLAAAADRALDENPAATGDTEQAFLRVAGFERGFWQMAFGGG